VARWRSDKWRESKRKQRLIQKAQKAHAIVLLDEILQRPTWNKRFHTIQAIRAKGA